MTLKFISDILIGVNMIAREKIKVEIDKVLDYLLTEILDFIDQIKTEKPSALKCSETSLIN
ncbi:hypothetical protein H8E88_24920 [candidate division KSB1 bacterium]|nr:hypothetical protein [candidate division KSB1 bacterium]